MIVELDLENNEPYFQQSFTAFDGREILATFRWNVVSSAYCMSLYDIDNDKYLVAGIPLVLGCDILEPYGQLKLGSLILVDMNNTGIDQSINDLKTRVKTIMLE